MVGGLALILLLLHIHKNVGNFALTGMCFELDSLWCIIIKGMEKGRWYTAGVYLDTCLHVLTYIVMYA